MPPSQEEILIRLIEAEVKLEMLEETLRMDNETRTEFAKLKTRIFLLEKKVEALLKFLNPKGETMNEPKKTEAKSQTPDAVPVGHNEVAYPRTIPTHSVLHIVAHLRGQDTLSLPELGQHVATTIGCACELAKAEPVGSSGPDQPHGKPSSLSDEELANILESEVDNVNAPQSSVNPAGAFPVWLLPLLFEAAMRIFQEFQKRQQ